MKTVNTVSMKMHIYNRDTKKSQLLTLNSAIIFSSSLIFVVGLYAGEGVTGVDPAGVAGLTAALLRGVGAGESVKE